MSIKVFIKDMMRGDYRNNPATDFEILVPWLIARSTGGAENGPVADEGNFQIVFPIDSSPAQVYVMTYQKILALCDERGWETPLKSDIFAWIPTDFSVLIP